MVCLENVEQVNWGSGSLTTFLNVEKDVVSGEGFLSSQDSCVHAVLIKLSYFCQDFADILLSTLNLAFSFFLRFCL